MSITDAGEPGSGDKIALTVWDGQHAGVLEQLGWR
jgi:hypothetical protein